LGKFSSPSRRSEFRGHRRGRHVGDVIFGAGRFARCLGGIVERDIDVGRREAGDLDIEVEGDQTLQLNGEDFLIPAGLLRQPVVREVFSVSERCDTLIIGAR
jgi:hypothetical protein